MIAAPTELSLSSTSFSAFRIILKFEEVVLAHGTAFFVSAGGKFLLVTNKHNVLGRNVVTGECLDTKNAAIPDRMAVLLPDMKNDTCSNWRWFDIALYDGESRNGWVEHPNPAVDMVGFKFVPADIDVKTLALAADGFDLPLDVSMRVNVVGYPFGLSTDNFPIWSTGYTASEPAIDVDGKPLMYIDCRTRKGHSGSPVVKLFHPGETVTTGGQTYMAKQQQVYLLGIYSGRVNAESDIGMVWKKKAFADLFIEAERSGG